MVRACCLLALALSAFAPRLADACSPARCVGGAIAPVDGGTVPANLPGLRWRPLTDQAHPAAADPTKLTITRSGDATPVSFTARALANQDLLLVPDAPLTVGQTYEVNDATTCDGARPAILRSLFSVRAAAPLPATLGMVTASEQMLLRRDVSTPSGSCSAEVDAAVRAIWLAMDPGTDEWLELLQVQAFIDDQPYGRATEQVWGPPGTHQAGAYVEVHRTCVASDGAADPGLSAGSHTIRMEATLPGTLLVVKSNTISFDLDCQGHGVKDEPVAEDGGCNAVGAGSLSWLSALGVLVVCRRARRR